MIKRDIWLKRLQQAGLRRPVVWFSGVRRVGKTTLIRMLPDAVYMNCDLPSVVRALGDPELFLSGRKPGTMLVFDEVHRLDDPSRLLKIAADEYPHLKILATGTSTLAATRKFRDSLTAVAHRIRMLESHLGAELFGRRRRGVYLNRRGRAYYEEVRRILLDIRETTERHGDRRRFRGR